MANKASSLRLGVFIILGTVMLVLAIFVIGNQESMFEKTFTVRARFHNIEGLRKGASVRLSGIDVGSVKDIMIAPDSAGMVDVYMRLNNNISNFVNKETRALIATEGLVGAKVVSLELGSGAAEKVGDGGTIRGVDPLNFGAIVDEARGALENTREMTRSLAEIVQKVNEGEGSIGKLINDNELYNNTVALVGSADKSLNMMTNKIDTVTTVINAMFGGVRNILKSVEGVIDDIDVIVHDVKEGRGLLGRALKENSSLDSGFTKIIDNLIQITLNTREGAAKFEENMEALKRNWLFKNYFEQRGFYDRTPYEKQLDTYVKTIDDRIKELDERIERLRELKRSEKKKEQMKNNPPQNEGEDKK